MSYRPSPNADRIVHQAATAYANSGPSFVEAATNLASWGRVWATTFEFIDTAIANRPVTFRSRARRAARTVLGWMA